VSDLSTMTCIEDLRRVYKRRVPRMFYDYCDSGSWTEGTYRANIEEFQSILLRQRVAVNMTGRSTRSTMIGQDVAMPVALAPTGLTGMQHADGEILAARAAGSPTFCVPYGYNEGKPVDSADCDALVSDLLVAYRQALTFKDLPNK